MKYIFAFIWMTVELIISISVLVIYFVLKIIWDFEIIENYKSTIINISECIELFIFKP